MKVFTSDSIRNMERKAAESGISLAELMDRAGAAVFRTITGLCEKGSRVVLLCGKGNNGGDGFVCANLLLEAGYEVAVILVCGLPSSALAIGAYAKLNGAVPVVDAQKSMSQAQQEMEHADILVDAVFGFGFRGVLSGTAEAVVRLANGVSCKKLAVDLPSGTECDSGRADGEVFRADITVTFTALKAGNVSYPAKEYCGRTEVEEVGIPPEIIAGEPGSCFLTDDAEIASVMKPLDPQSNKGSRGRLLLACGSYGMAGACIMAAKAALRCGVGLLDIMLDKRIYPIVAAAVSEAVYTILDCDDKTGARKQVAAALKKADACVTGCGLGEDRSFLVPLIWKECRVPLLIDADGLNHLAETGSALPDVPVVLTPHPGEMARLTGQSIAQVQAGRLGAARAEAAKRNAVVLLKGAATVVASPSGETAVNPSGNAGMAKGGSGDVLAGIIGSLMAQGVPAFQAAYTGAYLHGLAGDSCARELSQRAMLPTDLIDRLPSVLKRYE